MHPDTLRRTIEIINPPPRLTVSEWAEQFAYLPQEGNAESGSYRTARMPHQMAMLDDASDPTVRESWWMGASQAMGKTVCLIIVCEYVIHQLRRSIIMARATKETALEWMRDKFEPTIAATPCMAGLLAEPRKRDSKSTSTNRRYPGGSIKIIGAKSPAAFRGTTAPVVLQDEIDSYEISKEGDPCALADRACITYSDAIKIKCSTTTIAGASRIHTGAMSGDQQHWFLPCPVCGQFQYLKTEQMKFSFTEEEIAILRDPTRHPANHKWTIGTLPVRDTMRSIYVCEHCQRGWTDQQRIASYMSGHKDNDPVKVNGDVLRSDWRALAPFKGIRSRFFSGMNQTIGLKQGYENYLHMFAEDFITAKRGGRETLMAWTNMFKNEPFEDAHEKVDWENLKNRAEDYGDVLPIEVMMLVAGVDIQIEPARVEIQVLGLGDNEEVWAIDYEVIAGDFDMPECQDMVAAFLNSKRYKHPILGELPITAKCIDSGKQTKVKAVYRFCKKYKHQKCWAIKGFASALGSIYTTAEEKRFGIPRYNLNVDYLKNTIADRLRNTDPGANYIHFPKEEITTATGKKRTAFSDKYFTGLCSERKFREIQKGGGHVTYWKKIASNVRNEPWDTMVYCFGAVEILKPATWIAQKWREVCKIIAERERGIESKPREVKEYILKPRTEAKQPELKQLPQTRQPTKTPRPGGGWIGIGRKGWL